MVPVLSNTALAAPATQPSQAERLLHTCAHQGDVARLRALIEAGVTVDAPDQRGCTALMLAAESGRLDAARELLQAGAEVDRRDGGKRRWTALMYALHGDSFEVAVALLQCGADPNAGDDAGYDPLMMAASRGDERVVEELLTRGADPTAELFLGFTALDYAIGYGHAVVVRLLLQAAPQLRRRRNPARRAVLALAGSAGDDEILTLLDD